MLEKIEKLKKLTILFVDDELDIIDIISDTLSKLNIDFYVAADGKTALNIMNSNNITLLVTDINMFDMDGLELLRIIRADNNNVDCIIMSAYTEDYYKESAKKLWVKQYIVKPFDFSEFLDAVNKL